MKNAYVICCNDSIEFIVIDDYEKAEMKLSELRNKYRNDWLKKYIDTSMFDFYYKQYNNSFFWHIHTVEYD
jgi:hypothetical protein